METAYRDICVKCMDLCLGLIIENISLINSGQVTHLFGDFRTNMGYWKALVKHGDDNLLKNFEKEEDNKDKNILFILFLLNDGVIEGHIYLLPTTDGKMNYALRVADPKGINSIIYKDMSQIFIKIKGQNK